MRCSGWKNAGVVNFSGSGESSAPSEVSATPHDGPGVDCSDASWAICSLYTDNSDDAMALDVYGTNGSGGSAQSSEIYFSQMLLRMVHASTVVLTLPDGAYGLNGTWENNALSNIKEVEGPEATLLVNPFLNMQGAKALQADNTADTGEVVTYQSYYACNGNQGAGSDTLAAIGPSWVAVPCGSFDQINFVYRATGAGNLMVLCNLLYG